MPYPRYDIGFDPPDDTLILICKTSKNGSCEYTGSIGELSISGWDDDRLEDYSVTLGKTCTIIARSEPKIRTVWINMLVRIFRPDFSVDEPDEFPENSSNIFSKFVFSDHEPWMGFPEISLG